MMNQGIYQICVTNRALAGIEKLSLELAENSYGSVCDGTQSIGWIAEYAGKIERALQQKPDALILREKDLTEEEYERLAVVVLRLCHHYNVKCFLNNFVKSAIRLKAHRIQLSISRFLELTASERDAFSEIIVSVHSVDEALLAESKGADAIIAGHIFSTDCKKGVPPRGLAFLSDVCQAVTIPVYAIGGIHMKKRQEDKLIVAGDCTASQCIEAGAAGVCMMSEYMKV